jgi:hypothetical protein
MAINVTADGWMSIGLGNVVFISDSSLRVFYLAIGTDFRLFNTVYGAWGKV